MIVLDEQLLGRGIEGEIAQWYPGSVRFITDLRPGTVIKDAAIPMLLSQANAPTFVTINETDFWRRIEITNRFCVVCLTLPDSRATETSVLLRRFLNHRDYRTKAQRTGNVVRITESGASHYSVADKTIRAIKDW